MIGPIVIVALGLFGIWRAKIYFWGGNAYLTGYGYSPKEAEDDASKKLAKYGVKK
jgi:hypothetical protein